MTHLRPEQFIDALDDALEARARVHVDGCASCRDQLAELSSVLDSAKASVMAEPSPLFWDHLSTRIHEAVVAEPGTSRVTAWWHWPVLAPVAAMAVVVVALATFVARGSTVQPVAVLADLALSNTATQESDAAWLMLSDAVGPLDIDTAQEAGIATTLGTADHVVWQLTLDEQSELLQILRQELR